MKQRTRLISAISLSLMFVIGMDCLAAPGFGGKSLRAKVDSSPKKVTMTRSHMEGRQPPFEYPYGKRLTSSKNRREGILLREVVTTDPNTSPLVKIDKQTNKINDQIFNQGVDNNIAELRRQRNKPQEERGSTRIIPKYCITHPESEWRYTNMYEPITKKSISPSKQIHIDIAINELFRSKQGISAREERKREKITELLKIKGHLLDFYGRRNKLEEFSQRIKNVRLKIEKIPKNRLLPKVSKDQELAFAVFEPSDE